MEEAIFKWKSWPQSHLASSWTFQFFFPFQRWLLSAGLRPPAGGLGLTPTTFDFHSFAPFFIGRCFISPNQNRDLNLTQARRRFREKICTSLTYNLRLWVSLLEMRCCNHVRGYIIIIWKVLGAWLLLSKSPARHDWSLTKLPVLSGGQMKSEEPKIQKLKSISSIDLSWFQIFVCERKEVV